MCPQRGTRRKVLVPSSRCRRAECFSVSTMRSSAPAIRTTGTLTSLVEPAERPGGEMQHRRFLVDHPHLRCPRRQRQREGSLEAIGNRARREHAPQRVGRHHPANRVPHDVVGEGERQASSCRGARPDSSSPTSEPAPPRTPGRRAPSPAPPAHPTSGRPRSAARHRDRPAREGRGSPARWAPTTRRAAARCGQSPAGRRR